MSDNYFNKFTEIILSEDHLPIDVLCVAIYEQEYQRLFAKLKDVIFHSPIPEKLKITVLQSFPEVFYYFITRSKKGDLKKFINMDFLIAKLLEQMQQQNWSRHHFGVLTMTAFRNSNNLWNEVFGYC
jgi:hypothetical protein